MDRAMIDQIVNYIEKVSNETDQRMIKITFHGGEPLTTKFEDLAYFVEQLVDRFSSERLMFSIQSNLWLLNEAHCELFSKNHFSLGTSLDGPREINDAQRGDGYFDKTMRGIKLAQSFGLPVSVIATFTNQSIKKWQEVFDFFMQKKLSFAIHSVVESIHSKNGFEMTTNEQVKFMNEAFVYYLDHADEINVPTFNALCKGCVSKIGQVCTFTDCLGSFLAIDPAGGIYSCQRFAGNPQYQLGSIFEAPSVETLFQSPMAKRMQKREEAVKDFCGECSHLDYCHGGCQYSAIVEDDVVSKSFCEVYQQIFSTINNQLIAESKSDKNIEQLMKHGPALQVNPLLRKGKAIDLIKPLPPYEVRRNAKRIVASYLMTQFDSLEETSEALFSLGLGKNQETLLMSLNHLKENSNHKRKKQTFGSMLDQMERAVFVAHDLSLDEAQEKAFVSCGECAFQFICGGISTDGDEKPICAELQLKAKSLLDEAINYLNLPTDINGGIYVSN
jgi:uncharacterized protein